MRHHLLVVSFIGGSILMLAIYRLLHVLQETKGKIYVLKSAVRQF